MASAQRLLHSSGAAPVAEGAQLELQGVELDDGTPLSFVDVSDPEEIPEA
eukprot:gene36632-50790_t